jgi:Flp pilus assembly protein TadD
MTRSIAFKFAASALAIGTTMAAWPSAEAMRAAAAQPEKLSADAAARARAAVAKGRFAEALPFAEQAVAAMPRDIAYRMLLADLYLKNGRFQSAAATYADVVALDSGNVRASMSLALCDIAQGRNEAAIAVLEAVGDRAPAADLGLAYALAGQPKRAIAMLEPAAHTLSATGRLRQNLAFAYAMAGDWEKARAAAAQDVSPADLGPRLAQWAALARPSGPADQVAALLGVHPAADSGQPERVALAPVPTPNALAAADPAPAPQPAEAAPAPAPAPVQPAAAAPEPAPVPVQQVAAVPQPAPAPAAPAPAPVAIASASSDAPGWIAAIREARDPKPEPAATPNYAGVTRSLVTPQPAVLRGIPALRPRVASFELPRGATRGTDTGRFAVQLGAFSSSNGVEHAWGLILKRFGFADLTPFSTTISVPGKGLLHRLSVAGFASRGEADRTCRSIRAKGGACFVRAVAGDAPPRWASRYAGHKTSVASR